MDQREHEELLSERRSLVRRASAISTGFWLSAVAGITLIVVGEFLFGFGALLVWALFWIAHLEFRRGPKHRYEARLAAARTPADEVAESVE